MRRGWEMNKQRQFDPREASQKEGGRIHKDYLDGYITCCWFILVYADFEL